MFEDAMRDTEGGELREAIEQKYYKDKIMESNEETLMARIQRLEEERDALRAERYELSIKVIKSLERANHAETAYQAIREEVLLAKGRMAEVEHEREKAFDHVKTVKLSLSSLTKKVTDTLVDRDKWMDEATKGQAVIRELKKANEELTELVQTPIPDGGEYAQSFFALQKEYEALKGKMAGEYYWMEHCKGLCDKIENLKKENEDLSKKKERTPLILLEWGLEAVEKAAYKKIEAKLANPTELFEDDWKGAKPDGNEVAE